MELVSRIFQEHHQKITAQEADDDMREFLRDVAVDVHWRIWHGMVTVRVFWCHQLVVTYLTSFNKGDNTP